jgi:hypothetical protein
LSIVETIVIIIGTGFFTATLLTLYMRRTLNNILTEVGQDVGEQFTAATQSIGQQLKESFTDPNVKRAMSILGKQSGEVRLNAAAERDVANALLDQYPEAKILINQFAPDILEKYGPATLLPLVEKYGKYLPAFLKGRSATQSTEKFGEF